MTFDEQQQVLEHAEETTAKHVAKHDLGALAVQMSIREASQRIAEHKAHAELQAEAEQVFKAAGLPERTIPYHAVEFKCGGKTSTFRIAGRSVTFGEFRAELARHGLKPENFARRLVDTGRPERSISRSVVTASADNEPPK